MGKIFVIEGLDGSGKETQAKLLCERLASEGHPATMISFPQYDNPGSDLVRHYLMGKFGNSPSDVNPYAAASFYACDRYTSYITGWKHIYENPDTIIVMDRYVGSNAICQAVKMCPPSEIPFEQGSGRYKRKAFFKWLDTYEHFHLSIPRANKTVLLDVPPAVSERLIATRANKITGADKKDIHEADVAFMHQCYQTAREAAQHFRWELIPCTDVSGLLAKETIHQSLYEAFMKTM